MPSETLISYGFACIVLVLTTISLLWINITLTSILESLAKEATTTVDKSNHDTLNAIVIGLWVIIAFLTVCFLITVIALIRQIHLNSRNNISSFDMRTKDWVSLNMMNTATNKPYTAYIPEKFSKTVTLVPPPPPTKLEPPGIVPANDTMSFKITYDAQNNMHKTLIPGGVLKPGVISYGPGAHPGIPGPGGQCHSPNDINAIRRELQVAVATQQNLQGKQTEPNDVKVNISGTTATPQFVKQSFNIGPDQSIKSPAEFTAKVARDLGVHPNSPEFANMFFPYTDPNGPEARRDMNAYAAKRWNEISQDPAVLAQIAQQNKTAAARVVQQAAANDITSVAAAPAASPVAATGGPKVLGQQDLRALFAGVGDQ